MPKNELIQETSVSIPERDRGRPKGTGRIMFTLAQLESLPDSSRICDIQRVLGITLASVQQWTERKINPLRAKTKNGRRWFDKSDIIAWMKATRHLEEEKENGHRSKPGTHSAKTTAAARAGKVRPK